MEQYWMIMYLLAKVIVTRDLLKRLGLPMNIGGKKRYVIPITLFMMGCWTVLMVQADQRQHTDDHGLNRCLENFPRMTLFGRVLHFIIISQVFLLYVFARPLYKIQLQLVDGDTMVKNLVQKLINKNGYLGVICIVTNIIR
eukprot:UN27143